MLKVLVTSGGTKVKIDSVRSITNMSRGTFGCKIATEFLKADKDIQLIFLRAEESCSPFLSKYYAFDGIFKNFISLYKNQKFYKKNKKRVIEIAYKTYEDYARTLNRLLDSHKPDITVLAAAVSDYIIPNPVSGKVRSSEDLKIGARYSSGSQPYHGIIFSIRITPTTFTAAQVLESYNRVRGYIT